MASKEFHAFFLSVYDETQSGKTYAFAVSHSYLLNIRDYIYIFTSLETAEARSKTRGGRLMLMGRILREKHFLAWITKPTPNERVSNPL